LERFQRITGESFFSLSAPSQKHPSSSLATSSNEFLREIAAYRQAFLDCMDDDFNTGGAIGVLHELLTALNRFADSKQLEKGKADAAGVADLRQGTVVLKELTQILGIFLDPSSKPAGEDDRLVADLMQLFIDLRAEARKAKNFALADQIRQRLSQLGITLEDRPGGTGWRRG
jgi:cysteinyl-tRNA synthetase